MLCRLTLLAILTASAANAQGNPDAGAAAYDAACGRCHDDPLALMEPTGLLGTAGGTSTLDAYLKTHKRAADNTASRADIVAYLMSLH